MAEVQSGKRVLKNTVYLYLRLLISLAIGIVTSRILLNVLGFEDYGLFSLVGGFVAFLTIFTGIFAMTASRFIAFEIGRGDEKQLKNTCATIINIISIASVIIFVIGSVIGIFVIKNHYLNIPDNKLDAAVFVYLCALVVFVLNFFNVPYQSIVMAHERMDFYAIMGIVDSSLKLVIVISLQYINSERLYYYAALLALASFSTRIFYGIYCSRNFPESRWAPIIDRAIARRMGSFSLWMGIGSAAGTFKDQGTTILLNLFFGLILNAVMGIVMQVNSLINSFTSNIGMAIAPQITKSYSCGDVERSKILTMISAKAHGFLILIIMTPFILETEYILDLWLKDYPEPTPLFVRWSLCICFITGISNAYVPLFLAIGRIKVVQLFGTTMCILYVCICYLLFEFGMPAIFSMQLLLIIMTLCMLAGFYSLKVYVNFPFWHFVSGVIIPYIIIGAIGLMGAYYIQTLLVTSFIRLLVCALTSFAIISLLSSFAVLDKRERSILKNTMFAKFHLR